MTKLENCNPKLRDRINQQIKADDELRKQHGNTKPPVEVICEECKQPFTVSPPSAAEGRKFCSATCAYSNERHRESIGVKLRKDRGSATCKQCGGEFKLKRHSGKGEFCAQKCAAKYTGSRTIDSIRRVMPVKKLQDYICAGCGSPFQDWKSSDRKYCSSKCASSDPDLQRRRVESLNANPNKARIYSRCEKGWLEIGGKRIFTRSSWEANYARYLQFQKDHSQIIEWEHEPETFWFEKIRRGVRSYLPDFRVRTSDGIEYHEVKGWMDPKSKTKIARMAKYHPQVKLVVIDQVRYRMIALTARSIVPNWSHSRNSR